MNKQTTYLKHSPGTTFAVAMLHALHVWSGRHYRRALLRQELRRIGLALAMERRVLRTEQAMSVRPGNGWGAQVSV